MELVEVDLRQALQVQLEEPGFVNLPEHQEAHPSLGGDIPFGRSRREKEKVLVALVLQRDSQIMD